MTHMTSKNRMPGYLKAAEVSIWINTAIRNLVSILILLVALFPLLWGLSTSLKPPKDIVAFPPQIIPENPTLEHYAAIFDAGVLGFTFNSILVSFFTVLLCLVFGVMCGYAVSRYDFRGRGLLMFSVMAVMSIPLPSLMVPTYVFLADIGLIDTKFGLVLLYTAYQLPIAVWVLYGYFESVPRELERAAQVDGYSRLQTLRKVVVPVSTTGLIAAGLFVLTFAWNDFVVALVMTSSEDARTLPIAIYNFLGYFGREWGPLTASAIFSIIPIIVLFVAFQRYFLSGMTGGSVKG